MILFNFIIPKPVQRFSPKTVGEFFTLRRRPTRYGLLNPTLALAMQTNFVFRCWRNERGQKRIKTAHEKSHALNRLPEPTTGFLVLFSSNNNTPVEISSTRRQLPAVALNTLLFVGQELLYIWKAEGTLSGIILRMSLSSILPSDIINICFNVSVRNIIYLSSRSINK